MSATVVLSGVAPAVLARLLGEEPGPGAGARGAQTKVNLLLDRLPHLRCGTAPEVAFAGTFRLWEDAAELEAAHAQAARGELPDRPPAELYCHTLTNPSIVAGDRHTLTLFGLHTPPELFAADEAATRDALVERYLDGLDEHLAEPIRSCLALDADGRPCVEAKTPLDLERELGLPSGDIFHNGLWWPWLEDDGGPGGRWGVAHRPRAHPALRRGRPPRRRGQRRRRAQRGDGGAGALGRRWRRRSLAPLRRASRRPKRSPGEGVGRLMADIRP